MSKAAPQARPIQHAPRSALARRVVLALLILPPLLALGLLAWATLTHRPRPVRTGDALLDAYLQALVESGQAGSMGTTMPSAEKDTFPPQQWQAWEQQFGRDSRFWMLCYYMRPYDPQYYADVPEIYASDANYLRTARARGCADWIVRLNLLRHEYNAWSDDARERVPLSNPGRSSTLAERLAFYRQLGAELARERGRELEQLQDELRKAGADQAQALYFLAQIALERGDLAQALREITAGNAAAHNSAGLGLPFDALTDAARQGRPLAGDSAIAGQLWSGYIPLGTPNSIRFKYMVRALVAWAEERQDLAALQELHRCCCRTGVSAGADYVQAMAAADLDQAVLDAAARLTPASDKVHSGAISQAQLLARQIGNAAGRLSPSTQALMLAPSVLDYVLDFAPATSCAGRYMELELLSGFGDDFIRQQTALSGPIREQFEALAAIDFTR